jgi:hypothetical protein
MGRTDRRALLVGTAIVIAAAVALLAMGRHPICTCGVIRLWGGDAHSPENSQQIADWYSLSHIIHGFLFYALLRWLAPRWPRAWRLVVAVAIEAGWELLENSPLIIDRYRQATIAIGYTGDTVLNSLSDILMMTIGFLFAARAPARLTIGLAIGFELLALAVIRDNLTLNVLMLAWPIDAIRTWQAGA